MATGAKLGYPTLFQRGNGASPEVFTTIAEVKRVSGFGVSRELIDVTNMDSANAYREFIAGLKTGVQFTCEVNFLPAHATQGLATGVAADVENGTTRNYRLILPYSPVYTFAFAAIALGWTPSELSVAAPMSATFTFQVTGVITGA